MPTVIQRGTDSSGRAIKASADFWAVWDQCCDVLGFTPTIVQGGWVGSSGAAASADTHAGDAFDIRLWDRTAAECDQMIRVFRSHAIAYWERYESQGFDLHAHMVPGPWAHPSGQALSQWQDYLNGRNGLASHGADYHWRPSPLVTTPPEADDMPYSEKELSEIVGKAVEKQLKPIGKRLDEMEKDLAGIVRRNSANLRVILKERFDATDADLDELLGPVEP